MEPNESGLSSYYHQRHPNHQSPTSAGTATSPPTNGIIPNTEGTTAPLLYPQSIAGRAPAAVSPSPLETVKRKRGRPRKYGTSEQGPTAKKTTSSSPSPSALGSSKKKDQSQLGSSSSTSLSAKKSQLVALGNAGQGFIPHVITVAAGEDVGQKIMLFMQQSKRDICILSASGSISDASLRQPATSGGSITYEGRFDILSLTGSYVRTEIGGRTGGLSVCLSSSDGQIVGGGVGGPLKAAGPVQVIIGTFSIDNKKDGVKGDASASKFSSPVGVASVSNSGFRSTIEPSGRLDHFMVQPRGVHDWRSGSSYEMTGHGAQQSPENGDYDQIPD